MKKLFSAVVLSLVAMLLFTACETEVDLFSDPKEVTVTYCILNAADSIQYVRLNKAFLTSGSAIEYAAEPNQKDYIYTDNSGAQQLVYEVEITQTEVNNPNNSISWTLDTTTRIKKDTGVFYNPWQMLYYFKQGENGAPDTLKPEYSYSIKVTDQVSGEVSTSHTELITPFLALRPNYNPLNPQIGFNYPASGHNDIYISKAISWRSAVNGLIYQPIIRFHYSEQSETEGFIGYVDWNFRMQTSNNSASSGEEMNQGYYPSNFYHNISAQLDPIPSGTTRSALYIEVIYWSATNEFYTFMQVNNPSQSIVQDRPEYTNIIGGLGLFTDRLSITRRFTITSTTLANLANPTIMGEDMGFALGGK